MVRGNPLCEFCAMLKLQTNINLDRAEYYNLKAHVKSIRPHEGVIINCYLTDKRKRIYEKYTKTFTPINFCPICGKLLRDEKRFKGKGPKLNG